MRLTVGKWLIGAGIGIAGLGSVAVALKAPLLGWLVFAGGILLAIAGAVYMLLETPRMSGERTSTRAPSSATDWRTSATS
jgi:hypothetical protein